MLGYRVCASIMLSSTLALPLNTPLLSSYDYIIVGGGPAGLTVAHRLSEDASVTVLFLEAGPADTGEDIVMIPGFIGHDIGGQYDWNLSTVAQTFLDGNARSVPSGRALGGGTLLNGMLWSRGGREDYEDWVRLGNPGWGWDDLLPYFMKSETFTPMRDARTAEEYSVREDQSVHGYAGPVNVSHPNYQWNSSISLFSGLAELGIPIAYDPNAGYVAGASFLPFDLDPVTQTRQTARRAYYDSIANRPNLWVAAGQTVTQVLFNGAQGNADASTAAPSDMSVGQGSSPGTAGIFGDGSMLNVSSLPPSPSEGSAAGLPATLSKRSLLTRTWHRIKVFLVKTRRQSTPSGPSLTATGVGFAPDAQGERQTIHVTREVVLAAGAIHTPQLLMLSGIGPAPTLQSVGITPLLDLPGVGQNLQDHMQVWCWYPYHNAYTSNPTELNTNQTFVDEAWHDYWSSRTGPFTSGAIDGVAFPSLPHTNPLAAASISSLAASQDPRAFLPATTHPSLLAGFSAQLSLLATALQDPRRAAYELINANDGDLTVASMRPLSRGSVSLASSLPFTPPLVDPRYGSNPLDLQVLREAIRFNARLINTTAMAELAPEQIYPPPNASDEEIEGYVRSKAQTEYHYSGTTAMMPRELGGVVDAELKVYGVSNLRVVDTGIFPLVPAGHLQAVVYGVAEKAADIIKSAWTSSRVAPAPFESSSAANGVATVDPIVVSTASDPDTVSSVADAAKATSESTQATSTADVATIDPPTASPAPITDVVVMTTWVTVYT
nr:hypothetical protein B0A51_09932 [Rachicladosporium sp. CCFEE 5018]